MPLVPEGQPELQKELELHATQPYIAARDLTCIQAAFENATFEMAGSETAESMKALIGAENAIWRNLKNGSK